jgi:hypothetical protein
VQVAFVVVQFAAIKTAIISEAFLCTGMCVSGGMKVGMPGIGVGSNNFALGGGR